jgi:hypothetical protein
MVNRHILKCVVFPGLTRRESFNHYTGTFRNALISFTTVTIAKEHEMDRVCSTHRKGVHTGVWWETPNERYLRDDP